jgi:hypothetical protein
MSFIRQQCKGLPLATVQKVLGGTTKAPRYQTIQALASVFPQETQYSTKPESAPNVVRVPGAAYATEARPKQRYPRQGSYTIDDYLALPDDQRVELIDGVIYDMSAPTPPHQLIGGEIYALLREFLLRKNGALFPLLPQWMSSLIWTTRPWSSRMYVWYAITQRSSR